METALGQGVFGFMPGLGPEGGRKALAAASVPGRRSERRVQVCRLHYERGGKASLSAFLDGPDEGADIASLG